MQKIDTERRLKAAAMLAAGRTIVETAKAISVDEKSIDKWKKTPEFLSMIQEATEVLRNRILSHGAAVKEYRIRAKRRRLGQLLCIARARGGDSTRGGAEWDKTGFMVQRLKGVGSGDNFLLTTEFELDTGLLREISNLEREIAEEMGELKKPPTTRVKEESLSETAMLLVELFPSPDLLAEAKAKFLQVTQRRQQTTTEE